MKATIYFAGDESVGDSPRFYEIELPIYEFDDSEQRETCRNSIKEFYSEWDGNYYPTWIAFEDETT